MVGEMGATEREERTEREREGRGEKRLAKIFEADCQAEITLRKRAAQFSSGRNRIRTKKKENCSFSLRSPGGRSGGDKMRRKKEKKWQLKGSTVWKRRRRVVL